MMKIPIIIADTDATVVSIFSLLTEQTPFSILSTNTGEETLELIKKNKKIPIVFLDTAIKDIPTIELIQKILETNPGTHIIIMTGYEISSLLNPAFDAGIFGILYKPFDAEEVLSIFKKYTK